MSARPALLWIVLGAAGALGLGCEQELGWPPVPRFTMEPAYVPLDDNFETEVRLDASASDNGIGDPDSPLSFAWQFESDRMQIVGGDASSPRLAIKVAGDRPMAITLTVATEDGQTSSLEQRLGVTIPDR